MILILPSSKNLLFTKKKRSYFNKLFSKINSKETVNDFFFAVQLYIFRLVARLLFTEPMLYIYIYIYLFILSLIFLTGIYKYSKVVNTFI